jgi:hypothetical protein
LPSAPPNAYLNSPLCGRNLVLVIGPSYEN